MCAFVETWWGCAGMCWPMIWTTSSDLDRLITVPSWEFFPWNSLNSPLWCVFDSSAVVALVHLFEERIHVGQGYAPPPRVTWSIESISFRWGDIFAWKKCGSLVKDIGFCRIWPFFPSPRSKEESKVTRRSGRVRSTEWEKRSMDQVHLLWARILMGFFVRNASTRPFRSESRRCQVIDIKNEDFSDPHQSLPYDFEWFHSGRTMKNDQLSPAFEAWSGIMKLRRQSEPTPVGEDCLPHLSMKKNITKSYEHVKLQSPQKTSDVRDPNQGFCLEFLPSIPVGSTAEADVKSFRHSVAWGYREAL